jgi:hypothetical protein
MNNRFGIPASLQIKKAHLRFCDRSKRAAKQSRMPFLRLHWKLRECFLSWYLALGRSPVHSDLIAQDSHLLPCIPMHMFRHFTTKKCQSSIYRLRAFVTSNATCEKALPKGLPKAFPKALLEAHPTSRRRMLENRVL